MVYFIIDNKQIDSQYPHLQVAAHVHVVPHPRVFTALDFLNLIEFDLMATVMLQPIVGDS